LRQVGHSQQCFPLLRTASQAGGPDRVVASRPMQRPLPASPSAPARPPTRTRARPAGGMAQEDICLVCADPLDWTGFGTCGHKEACSRCVARMRFVLGDNKCIICREESPQAYFTRFSGDYTVRMSLDQFQELPVRVVRGGAPGSCRAWQGGERWRPHKILLAGAAPRKLAAPATLQARAKRGEVFQLKEVEGFFDDQDHYEYIK